jgi:hypothetical protein
MSIVVGIALWAVVIWGISEWSASRKRTRSTTPVRRPAPRPPRSRTSSATPPGAPIAGWLIGHDIARGHHGFPGDPLPHGHLGSPANLAFWGGMFDESDDEDEDDEDS